MEQSNGIQAIQSYEQTTRARDAERRRLDQLAVGGLLPAAQALPPAQDLQFDVQDRFALSAKEPSSVNAAAQVKPPEAGQPLPLAPGEQVLPVDGRGAAVALQEKLQTLLDTPEFEQMAQALGVQDISAFARVVERGDALETFALVDPSNIYLVDAQRREINADQLASFARAELVIRPGNRPEGRQASEVDQRLQEQLENPVLARIQDPALQIQDQLAQRPPQPQDVQQVIG